MTIEEYYENFKQDLLDEAGAEGNYLAEAFVEKMCAVITEQGVTPDADTVCYKFTQRGIAVDAWTRDAERAHLTLLVADFRNSAEIETITSTDIKNALKRLDRFVKECGKKTFVEYLEDSDPVVPLARYLMEHRSEIKSLDYILLTDARISSRVKEIKPSEYQIEYAQKCEVWDIQRLYELESSGREREILEVDFSEYDHGGIDCLRASTGEACLQSYLLVLPGKVLADLYEKYGERLFEQNVRTFLQFRGKVNKGIRNTIAQQPSMFFAYNNGLSATGDAVKISADGNRILRITNLQIVNGGQTTASIYTAWRKEETDLSAVFVQVKLSIVESEKVNDIVPKISEYANTQNKVNAADFFSNHPFHLRMEEFSRRLWAPAADGSPRQTHWFYERARGQYVNAQAKLSKANCVKFLAQNPKNQMFTKTDLAKFCLTFQKMPHLVSRGAQFAFAGAPGVKGFAKSIGEEWDARNGDSINELWFREAMAKAILFKSLDKTLTPILKQKNFGSYKACIISYTLAKFVSMVESADKSINFEQIWNMQQVVPELQAELVRISEQVADFLVSQQTHVVQLAKTESCWQRVMELPITLSDTVDGCLRYADEQRHDEQMATKNQRVLNGIHTQQYIFEKGETYWWKLRDWNEKHQIFSPKEAGVLDVACKMSYGKVQSELQAKILLAAEKRAIEEGFFIE